MFTIIFFFLGGTATRHARGETEYHGCQAAEAVGAPQEESQGMGHSGGFPVQDLLRGASSSSTSSSAPSYIFGIFLKLNHFFFPVDSFSARRSAHPPGLFHSPTHSPSLHPSIPLSFSLPRLYMYITTTGMRAFGVHGQ